jgi:polyisoprenoid-binding protein YceI
MKKYGILVVALATIWEGGCSTRLDHSNTVGTTPRPAQSRPAAAGMATNREVALSAENTRVTFIGTAGTTSHEGTFERLSGRWELRTDDPKDSRLTVQIEVDSLRTRIALLTAHLKRSDFLDAKQFPVATFQSTAIMPEAGPNGTTHRVTGDFTIHGVTQPISFPAKITLSPGAASFEATFPVKQTAFGMVTGAEKAQDNVPVTVVVNASRQ